MMAGNYRALLIGYCFLIVSLDGNCKGQLHGETDVQHSVRGDLEKHDIGLTKKALVEALHNDDAEVRSLAATELLSEGSADLVPLIVSVLQGEKDSTARLNIAQALARAQVPIGVNTLTSTCNDNEQPVRFRWQAMLYLLNIQEESCLNGLLQILRSDPNYREGALLRLQRFTHTSQLQNIQVHEAVRSCLRDPDPKVRIAAALTASKLGDAGVIADLRHALLIEQDKTVRSEFEDCLKTIHSH